MARVNMQSALMLAGTWLVGALLNGCAVDAAAEEVTGTTVEAVVASVNEPMVDSNDDSNDAEEESATYADKHGWYALVSPAILSATGRRVGDQIRVATTERAVVFTIKGLTNSAPIAMNDAGLGRLAIAKGAKVNVSDKITKSELDDARARKSAEYVERVGAENGNFLLALAPHGGAIEANTDSQADYLASQFSGKSVSWSCRGWGASAGAFDRWHVRSEDMSFASYPELQKLSGRSFKFGVSFHGWRNDYILVGGGAPISLRKEIGTALRAALEGTGIKVRVAGVDQANDGNLPQNLTNRLVEGNAGIQIEQSSTARDQHWKPIAQAVADVLAKHQ